MELKLIITSSRRAELSAANAANKSLSALKASFAKGILSLDSVRLGSIESGKSLKFRSTSFSFPMPVLSLVLFEAKLKTHIKTIIRTANDAAARVMMVDL